MKFWEGGMVVTTKRKKRARYVARKAEQLGVLLHRRSWRKKGPPWELEKEQGVIQKEKCRVHPARTRWHCLFAFLLGGRNHLGNIVTTIEGEGRAFHEGGKGAGVTRIGNVICFSFPPGKRDSFRAAEEMPFSWEEGEAD